jgi:hypothetical protein
VNDNLTRNNAGFKIDATGEALKFPRVWREDEEASCDGFPIWWTTKQVGRYLARREQARRSRAQAEEHRGFVMMAQPDIHEQIKGRELELIRLAAHADFTWPPKNGGTHVICPFPGHPDKRPSWRWDDKKRAYFCSCNEGGKGGGSAIDAVMALRGLDFKSAVEWSRKTLGLRFELADNNPPKSSYQFADAAPSPKTMRIHGSLPSQFWVYRAANGKIAKIQARYEQADGGKEFRPWTFNGRIWNCKDAPAPRSLYNLPGLLDRPDADILFVEGEKPADAAADLFPEMVATTTGSKTSHGGVDYSPCKDRRRVFLWPDNDHDGGNQRWIEEVARHCLAAGATEVRLVPVPGES